MANIERIEIKFDDTFTRQDREDVINACFHTISTRMAEIRYKRNIIKEKIMNAGSVEELF